MYKNMINEFAISLLHRCRKKGFLDLQTEPLSCQDSTQHQRSLLHTSSAGIQMKKTRIAWVYAVFLPWLSIFLFFAFPAICTANQDEIKADIRSVIELQLDAFARGDATAAYAQASPAIQSLFPTEEIFMMMVRSGYAALIAPRRVDFLELFYDQIDPVYRVGIESPDGTRWMAFYRMAEQPDLSWRIAGCVLTMISGQSV